MENWAEILLRSSFHIETCIEKTHRYGTRKEILSIIMPKILYALTSLQDKILRFF